MAVNGLKKENFVIENYDLKNVVSHLTGLRGPPIHGSCNSGYKRCTLIADCGIISDDPKGA